MAALLSGAVTMTAILPRQRQLHRLDDVLIGGLAAGGGDLAVDDLVAVLGRDVDDGYHAVARAVERIHVGQARAEQLVGALEEVEIADHRRGAAMLGRHLLQRLDDDLRADPGRVAHGDADFLERVIRPH